MTATVSTLGEATLADLRAEIRGEVVTRDDPGYDAARAVWNGMHDRRPALLVRSTTPGLNVYCGLSNCILTIRLAAGHRVRDDPHAAQFAPPFLRGQKLANRL